MALDTARALPQTLDLTELTMPSVQQLRPNLSVVKDLLSCATFAKTPVVFFGQMRFTRKFCLSPTDAMNGMDVVFLRNRHLGTTLFGDVILECHCI